MGALAEAAVVVAALAVAAARPEAHRPKGMVAEPNRKEGRNRWEARVALAAIADLSGDSVEEKNSSPMMAW